MTNPSAATPAAHAPDRSSARTSGARFGWGWTLTVAALSGLFLLLSYVPLRATDLWGHELYGEWILDHRELPREDPFLPLAAGMEVVDTDWVSQVAFAATHRRWGAEGLSLLFALAVTLTYALYASSFRLLGRGRWGVAAGLGGLLVVGWSRLYTIRPENFAALCFALVVWLLVRSGVYRGAGEGGEEAARPGPAVWLGVPLLAALWANVHGSFPVVVLLLGALALGRGIDVARSQRSLGAALADASFRRLLLLAEAALVATLVNPYGFDLWRRVAEFSSNPNLADISEWQPLALLGVGGREFLLSVVALLFLMRLSRRRLWAAEALLLAVFGGLAIFGVRMLSWYAPVFALVVARHAGRRGGERARAGSERASSALSPRVRIAVAALAVWVAFSLSPAGGAALGGAGRTPAQLYGPETPLALTLYLRTLRPAGLALAPQWWADWLVRHGPPGFRPMVGTNIHLIPPRVWQDYMRVQASLSGWIHVLDRYRIDTVVLDRARQEAQTGVLRRSAEWALVHEDPQAVVFARRSEAPRQPPGESPDE